MTAMSKWDRVEAAVRGEAVDRVPVSFWRHFAVREWSPRSLAELTLDQYRDYDLDIIKLTPTGIYPTQDWGPTIRFSRDDRIHPAWVDAAIRSPEEWPALPGLDVTAGALGRELEAIRILASTLDEDVPLVMTLYTPLTIASILCWTASSRDRIVQDLRQAPQQMHAGLAVIRDVVTEYAAACLEAGVNGIFMATQMAHYDVLKRDEYEAFGRAYDLPILESIAGRSRLTMLHACRQNVMFDLIADYPVDVIHWNDRAEQGPNLAAARQRTSKALSGGVAVDTLLNGTAEEVLAEARDAIAQTAQIGFILAPTCTVDGRTPETNLRALCQAAQESASS